MTVKLKSRMWTLEQLQAAPSDTALLATGLSDRTWYPLLREWATDNRVLSVIEGGRITIYWRS